MIVQKRKNMCPRNILPTVLSVGILPQTCDYCGTKYFKSIYRSAMEIRVIFAMNFDWVFGQYTWYDSVNLLGIFGVKGRGVRRTLTSCPTFYHFDIPQSRLQCTHQIDTFSHKSPNVHIHSSTNLTVKNFRIKTAVSIFIKILLPVVFSACSLG